MSSLLLSQTSPFLTNLQIRLTDRLEQCYRQARRLIRPFRYWNFERVLKIAHHSLALYGIVIFWLSNRCITNSSSADGRNSNSAVATTHTLLSLFRRHPQTWTQAAHQLTWFVYVAIGGGFPFYAVQHPTHPTWFRHYLHPVVYWGYLSVYKCIFSTWHAVRIANFLTDPRRNPPPTPLVTCGGTYYAKLWKKFQRDRIVRLQNLRYQHQWSKIIQELHNSENQRTTKAVRIDNRWVALGGFGAAVQDVIDDTLDRHLMRPARVAMFFQRLGQAFPHLKEVSVSMTLNLPLMAISALLEHAPNLDYLRLDGVALSVHDLQPDLLEFGRSLHGLGAQHQLRLKTLLLEDCRLENDEPDPQLRTRYSMDLLLAPAIYTALTPPTRLQLEHLRLWVQCQRISALELAVMLGQNTTLTHLDLHLTRDNSNDIQDDDETEDPVEWILLPLAQVLHYRNTTLRHLTIQLPTTVTPNTLSHKALVQMMQGNETLQTVQLIRTDTQATIRIPEVDFYLHCNRLGRHQFRLDCQRGHVIPKQWVDVLIQEKRNTAVVYYFLAMNPPLLLNASKNNKSRQQRQADNHNNHNRDDPQPPKTKSWRKAWQLLHRKAHWATLAYDAKK